MESALEIAPGVIARVPSGVAVAVPEGYVGLVRDRSSMAIAGLHTVAGVIDSDYRGEILVALHNAAAVSHTVQPGDRIAQMLVLPCPRATVEETGDLPPTQRGDGGFGSTGR
jgi:dUTP pyrophosphatase